MSSPCLVRVSGRDTSPNASPGRGPDVPQRAEEWTEINPGARPVAVVARHIYRRQAGLEIFQINPLTCFRYRNTRRHATFHVYMSIPLHFPC